MSYAFQIDPREVLGVGADASLAELREAYRARSRKYHPDVGGDEWAFRVLTRAYEILSAARVQERAAEELRREAAVATSANPDRPSATTGSNPFGPVRPARTGGPDGSTRVGVRDTLADPSRLVAVEMLLLRYELQGVLGLLAGAPENRNLSCTLDISWPTAEAANGPHAIASTLDALRSAFEAARATIPPLASNVRVEGERFVGLLSYPTAIQADAAFKAFRNHLKDCGLGVIQTIREIVVPRD